MVLKFAERRRRWARLILKTANDRMFPKYAKIVASNIIVAKSKT